MMVAAQSDNGIRGGSDDGRCKRQDEHRRQWQGQGLGQHTEQRHDTEMHDGPWCAQLGDGVDLRVQADLSVAQNLRPPAP